MSRVIGARLVRFTTVPGQPRLENRVTGTQVRADAVIEGVIAMPPAESPSTNSQPSSVQAWLCLSLPSTVNMHAEKPDSYARLSSETVSPSSWGMHSWKKRGPSPLASATALMG